MTLIQPCILHRVQLWIGLFVYTLVEEIMGSNQDRTLKLTVTLQLCETIVECFLYDDNGKGLIFHIFLNKDCQVFGFVLSKLISMTPSIFKKRRRVENEVSFVFGPVIGRGCGGIPAFEARLINETKLKGQKAHESEIRRRVVTLTCAVAFRIRTSCKRTLNRSHISNAYTILSKKRCMSGEISKCALTTMPTMLSIRHD